MPRVKCIVCDEEFMWHPSQKSGKYCNQSCQIIDTLRQKIESGVYSKNNALTYFKRTMEYKCSCCGVTEYNNMHIRLQIDHIDGDNTNNTQSNLRYLCPNCHTQTDTWGVKNVSKEGRIRMNEGGRKGRLSRSKQ